MLGYPGSGSKVWEALDREIGKAAWRNVLSSSYNFPRDSQDV
jgi:hypothetical protein